MADFSAGSLKEILKLFIKEEIARVWKDFLPADKVSVRISREMSPVSMPTCQALSFVLLGFASSVMCSDNVGPCGCVRVTAH